MSYQPKSYRKFLATSVTAAVVTTAVATGASAATVETQNTTQFSDVSSSYFAAGEIYRLVEKEIISGYPDGTFKPGQNINRGQAATLLVKAAGLEIPESVTDRPFSDVSVENNFAAVLTAMKDAGFIGGYSDGTYRAGAEITREQMASILVRTFALENTGADVEVADLASAHASHQDNIVILAQNGITQVENFRPKESVTRAQFATFVDRALTNQYTEELGLSGIEFVDTNTVEVAFDRVLTAEEVAEMTFAFSPELEVTAQELKTAEVSSSDAGSVVVLTTADQDPEQDYRLWVNGERTTLVGTGSEVLPEPTPGDELVVESVTAIDATTISVLFEGMEEAVVIELDEELVDGDNEVTFTYNEQEFTVTVTFEAPVEGLVVESVSAINTTGITLSFKALEEDLLGETVTVLDPNGNEVAVKAQDLSAGETEAVFVFENAYTSFDAIPSGVWKINGTEYDFAAQLAVKAVKEAGNQVQLLAALQSDYFTGVNEDLIAQYEGKFGDAATVADIQAEIDKVNKEQADSVKEAAVVKAVVDANTQPQLLAALNANFDRVNADWIQVYANTAVAGKTLLTLEGTADYAAIDSESIQAIIDVANLSGATNELVRAEAELSTTSITRAENLINSYVKPDTTEPLVTTKAELLKRVAEHKAVIAVNEATTNNILKTRLNTLATTVNDAARFDIRTVNDVLLPEYRAAITSPTTVGETTTEKLSASGILDIVKAVNAAELEKAVSAITTNFEDYTSTDTDDQKEAIKELNRLAAVSADLDAKEIDASLIATYITDIKAGLATITGTNAEKAGVIQGIIDSANGSVVETAVSNVRDEAGTNAADLLTALKDINLGLTDVKDANRDAYFTAAVNKDGDKYFASVSNKVETQRVVNAVNAYVEANSATTATDLRTALTTFAVALVELGGVNEASEFIDLTNTAKLEVAEIVLNAKEDNFTTAYTLGQAVDAAMTAHKNFLTGVNGAGSISAMNTALNNENVFPEFYALSPVAKVEKAEAVYNKLQELKAQDPATDYKTIAQIKVVAGL